MTDDWKWTKIADHDTLTEGPVWDGSGLLYNECSASTTFRWDPKTNESTVWRTNTGATNGMTFDRQGQLFCCEGGANRVALEMVAARVERSAFNVSSFVALANCAACSLLLWSILSIVQLGTSSPDPSAWMSPVISG